MTRIINVSWAGSMVYVADAMQILTPVADTEDGLFSFKTGMELVYMESIPVFRWFGIFYFAGCRRETLYLRDQYVE